MFVYLYFEELQRHFVGVVGSNDVQAVARRKLHEMYSTKTLIYILCLVQTKINMKRKRSAKNSCYCKHMSKTSYAHKRKHTAQGLPKSF